MTVSPLQFGDYQPIDHLPDEICLELGRLVAAFAHLEWLIQRTLWQAFGLGGKQGRVLTGAMNTRARVDAMTLGVTIRFGKSDLIAEARAIDAAAVELQTRRNEFVHGTWATSQSHPGRLFVIVTSANAAGRARPRAVSADPAAIIALARKIVALASRIDRFSAKLSASR